MKRFRACSKLVADSFERTLDKPETLLPACVLLNRIRLCASDAVLSQSEQVLQRITEQYFSPNLSVDEIRSLVRSGKVDADPLKSLGRRAAWRSNLFAPGPSREAKRLMSSRTG